MVRELGNIPGSHRRRRPLPPVVGRARFPSPAHGIGGWRPAPGLPPAVTAEVASHRQV